MQQYYTYDIIKKLIGSVHPVGETNFDDKTFENLKEYCELYEQMTYVLQAIARERTSPLYSVKRSGQYAFNAINDLKHDLFDEED